MLAQIWQSVCGYVMISVEGLSLERFINLALTNHIRIWDISRESYVKLQAKVTRKGFFRLRVLMRRMPCRMHVVEKHGIAGHLGLMRTRFVLIWGALAAFVLLLVATSFLWQVRIIGVENANWDKLQQAVESAGVHRGMLLRQVDLRRVEQNVSLADPNVAWAGARLRGVELIVEVVEGKIPPKLVDKTVPANIVSKKDAVVVSVTALEGSAKAKEGDVVRRGEVLIGQFERTDAPLRMVHARGEVIGRVWYSARAAISPSRSVKKRTGRKTTQGYLLISGWQVPLLRGEPFELYETEEISRKSMERLYLPLYWVRENQYELEQSEEVLDAEEMLIMGRSMAYQKALAKVDSKAYIVGRTERVSKHTDGTLVVEVFLEAEESIGVTTEFVPQEYMLPAN